MQTTAPAEGIFLFAVVYVSLWVITQTFSLDIMGKLEESSPQYHQHLAFSKTLFGFETFDIYCVFFNLVTCLFTMFFLLLCLSHLLIGCPGLNISISPCASIVPSFHLSLLIQCANHHLFQFLCCLVLHFFNLPVSSCYIL